MPPAIIANIIRSSFFAAWFSRHNYHKGWSGAAGAQWYVGRQHCCHPICSLAEPRHVPNGGRLVPPGDRCGGRFDNRWGAKAVIRTYDKYWGNFLIQTCRHWSLCDIHKKYVLNNHKPRCYIEIRGILQHLTSSAVSFVLIHGPTIRAGTRCVSYFYHISVSMHITFLTSFGGKYCFFSVCQVIFVW